MSVWETSLYSLIVRTSTDLPEDVDCAIQKAEAEEDPASNAAETLRVIRENVRLAREKGQPICQDTGTIMFWVEAPPTMNRQVFQSAAEKAIAQATRDGILRQNCVDTLTGRNTGNNLGVGSPVIHWNQTTGDKVTVSLVLKGGGCENVGVQYSLPDRELGAGRDLEGVRRCLLDAVVQAQGKGCAPGILGVCIGGDRATGYEASKEAFLRRLGQRNPEPELAQLEERVIKEANSLGIGPMGFGGKTTLLDVFITTRCRLPASYFVSVSYMCWAYRRHTVRLTLDGTPVE